MKKKQIDNRLIGRRQFLAGSSAMLFLPPLLSLMPDKVAAQVVAGGRRRSITWVGMCGIDGYQLFPPNQADMTPLVGATSTYYKPLSRFTGNSISRMIDRDFESIFPYMNLMQGLSMCAGDWNGGAHNCTVLGGHTAGDRVPAYGASIDVIMENSPNVYKLGEAIPHKAIRMHTSWGGSQNFSFRKLKSDAAPVFSAGIQGDRALFNKLFGSFTGGTAAPTTDKVLIVDKIKGDLDSLKQSNKRLSASDTVLLDSYINSIYELQVKVKAPAGAVCTKPTMTFQATKDGNGYNFPENFGVTNTGICYDNIIELMRLAFVCDMTRVFFMGSQAWSDLPEGDGGSYRIHHDCGGSDVNADSHKWGLKKFLKLGKALQATADPFGGGNLLDNSTMLYTNELAGWTTDHLLFNYPAVLLGKGGGYFNTGYFIDYRQKPLKLIRGDYIGRPYKQMLQSVMASMGVTKQEYSQYGTPDASGTSKYFGQFEVGINQYGEVQPNAYAAYSNEHNDPLPQPPKLA